FNTVFINSNNQPLAYSIFPDIQVGSFASFNKQSGTTNDTALVHVNPALVQGVGTFCETWFVSADSAINSPQTVVICMTINPVIPPDSSILSISDTLFIFESSVDTPFIGGDILLLSNAGTGPDFGWTITKLGSVMINGTDTVLIVDSLFPAWIDVAPLSGVTPDTAFISVDNQGLAPATYVCAFQVDADSGIFNSPQYFAVVLIVNPATPEGMLGLSKTLFELSSQVDVPIMKIDTLRIFNALRPDNSFGWSITPMGCWYDSCTTSFLKTMDTAHICTSQIDPDSSGITVAPLSGATPGQVVITINNDGLAIGLYWCEFRVDADSGILGTPQTFRVQLFVNPPPSVDTLYVSTVPGTPGSKVKVPVNFINSGPICLLDIPLEWASSKIFLDSVSFVGTRLEGFEFLEFTIDNSLRQVRIIFRDNGLALPPGDGKVANLYFEIFSGITEGGIVPIDTFQSAIEVDCFFPMPPFSSPVFFPGGIVIDSSANVICGRVIDTAGNEIPGATVQIWDNFPQGTQFAEQITDFNGSFKFQQLFVVPYTVYAYAEGYYPNTLEDINFGALGLEVVLTPVSTVNETQESMEFFCNTNTFLGVPLPVGSVVDAFDPDGDHVGSYFVTSAGSYGFMPVYRDDPTTEEDDGADPGDIITFYINGMPTEATGNNTWTFDGDRQEVCLNFDGSTDKTICLGLGWSLISWNVDTEIDDVQALFGPIMQYVDVIRSFEEVALTFDPDLVEFSTLTSADHLHGYFINIESLPQGAQCVELTFSGLQELVNAPINLEANWNLVSYLPPVELPTASALVSQEGNLRIVLGYDDGGLTYDPALVEFSTLLTMRPCFGYWLKVFNSSTLIYPGFNSAPIIDDEYIGDEPVGVLAKLGIEGRLNPTPISLDIYSGGLVLDGRTVSGGTPIEILDKNEVLVGYGITSAGGKLMFTPVYGAESSDAVGLKSGDLFTIAVDGRATIETFEFTANGDRFEIRELTSKELSTLPSDFALAQNYPNPFNPSTRIKFSLPSSGQVTLDIFNILGEKVATLADGFYEAGENEVIWDARSASGAKVASGIYFYRLRAGGRTLTKTMALMK
ncbi:MAG: carboxypeptidase regulatory-like domain-containing protein, partial [candidate division Zixibacteria bacterium]|nr:carboxypeptidase regulatory-like domain-containing protein [candidate division Zixibacteria bacterium]